MAEKGDHATQTGADEVVKAEKIHGELIQPPAKASEAKNAAQLLAYHLSIAKDDKFKSFSLWRSPETKGYYVCATNPFVGGVLKNGIEKYTENELWGVACANNYFAERGSELFERRKKQWSNYQ